MNGTADRRLGVRPSTTPEQELKIIQLYTEELIGFKAIAKRLGFNSITPVRRCLIRNGVELRTSSEGKRVSVAYRNKKFGFSSRVRFGKGDLFRKSKKPKKKGNTKVMDLPLFGHAQKLREKDQNKIFAARWKERYHSDPGFRVKQCLRSRMKKFVDGRSKSASTAELIGCDHYLLQEWISTQWEDWMTWDNYGSEWHIDHIVPCSWFDHEDPDQQRLCWNYQNLRPLCGKENKQRSASGRGAQRALGALAQTPIVRALVEFVEQHHRRPTTRPTRKQKATF